MRNVNKPRIATHFSIFWRVFIFMFGLLFCANQAKAVSAENEFVRVSCDTEGVRGIVAVGTAFHLITMNVDDSFIASVQVEPKAGWQLLSASPLMLSPGRQAFYRVQNILNSEIEETGEVILFKVDVEIDGIGESLEESEGAFVGYADCSDGYSNTNCTFAMKSVKIRCLPDNRPDNEEIVLQFSSGQLLEKVGETYQTAKSSYKVQEIASKSFWLHGHAVSTSPHDYEIKAEHNINHCKDIAKYTVFELSRIVLVELHGNIDHGTSREYAVVAYDNFNREITKLCSIEWNAIEPSVGIEIRTESSSGLSWRKTWNILDGENSIRPDVPICYAAIFVEASLFGGSSMSTSCQFNVNKGTVIRESSEYVKTVDSIGESNRTSIGSPVIIDRTDVLPSPQATYTVGGEITVEGSVTVTGNAKASIGVPLTSVSAEVSVGVAGQTSVCVKKPWSLSGSVTASNQYDIMVQMYKTTADRNQLWDYFRRKDYNTGFHEVWADGTVSAHADEGAIHVEFVYLVP